MPPSVPTSSSRQVTVTTTRALWVINNSVKHFRYWLEQSPFWDANRSAGSQEFSLSLWNLKVPYHIYKRQPPVPILSQINPVYAYPLYILKVHFNISFPSTPRSSKWFLSLKSLYQNPVYTSTCIVSRTYHMPHPSHSSWFYHPINIWRGIELMKLLVMYSSLAFYHVRLGWNSTYLFFKILLFWKVACPGLRTATAASNV